MADGDDGAEKHKDLIKVSLLKYISYNVFSILMPGSFDSFLQIISKFRDEELEHLDTGLEHDAEQVQQTLLCD